MIGYAKRLKTNEEHTIVIQALNLFCEVLYRIQQKQRGVMCYV